MRRWLMAVPLLVLVLPGAGCATRPPAATAAYEVETALVYTPAGAAVPQRADLYLPRAPGSGLRPALVVVHGGGWIRGERAQMKHIAEAVAEHGFVVLNIDYRLAPQHPYPAAADDVRSALRWLQANAARLRVDPQRLGLWGYSAGAHLAALVAARPEADLPVAAAIAGGIPADLVRARDSDYVKQFMGVRYEDQPQRYVEASPLRQLSAASAPMFFYTGSWDKMVDPRYSQQMRDGLRAVGVDAELCTLAGRGHMLAFVFDGAAVKGALAFLDRHFAAAAH